MNPQLPKWFVILIAASLILASDAGAVAAGKPSDTGSETLKLAILAPITGPAESFGRSARDGALLAIAQQNAGGGILGRTVAPLIEDTACNATMAVDAAHKVIDQEGVRYIIGDVCSGSAAAMAEVTNAAGVIQMAPTATNPSVTLNGDGSVKPYTFRACYIDPFQGQVGAWFARNTLTLRKAFILLDPNNPYVKGLAGAFEAAFVARGGQIAGKAEYSSQDTDFSPVLARVAAATPDMIYLPDFYPVVNLVTKQAKEKGITAPFLGGDGWESPDLDIKSADGGYFTTHFSLEDPRPEVAAFDHAFRAAYGYPPDSAAALGYDSARLIFQALREAGTTDTATVKTKLAGIAYQGVTGSLIYDGNHNPFKSAAIMRVSKDAGIHLYTLVSPPQPLLTVNYPNGRPGSFFTFTGAGYPPGRAAAVIVNGHTVTDTLPVDAAGAFSVQLSTAAAGAGRYYVTAAVNPSATAAFTLDAAAPLRPQEGSGPVVAVPEGIAYTRFVYQPFARR
jgi:branched-chain amino acid transport system substrate-binding protein